MATCNMRCDDCHVCTYEIEEFPFLLEDDVWRSACPSDPEVMLCVGCVERRLGRELALADFAEHPCNLSPNISERLRDRLSRHPPGVKDYRCPACDEAGEGCGGSRG